MGVPSVIEDRLIFTVEDPDRSFTRVSLDCDDAIEGRRRFRRTRTGWALAMPRPPLSRVEYRLVVTDRAGETEVICDDANPERVATAFGERSVALMPGYERPAWVRDTPPTGRRTELVHSDDDLGDLPVTVWSPDGIDDEVAAPLLVVHDGPEYDALAALTTYATAMTVDEMLPAFRVALMQPADRDVWYAANPAYLDAARAALDLVTAGHPVAGDMVAMGASLGGLSALLLALGGSGFGGVFSQSGSFFTPEHDDQESTYPYFDRVAAAVAAAKVGPSGEPFVVGMTCGEHEENWANNAEMAAALHALGHPVTLTPTSDLHNYTAWRDSLDPTLTDLLRTVWGPLRMKP